MVEVGAVDRRERILVAAVLLLSEGDGGGSAGSRVDGLAALLAVLGHALLLLGVAVGYADGLVAAVGRVGARVLLHVAGALDGGA